jgi:hypothetical protein
VLDAKPAVLLRASANDVSGLRAIAVPEYALDDGNLVRSGPREAGWRDGLVLAWLGRRSRGRRQRGGLHRSGGRRLLRRAASDENDGEQKRARLHGYG